MDLSQLSDSDLRALAAKDFSKVSTEGLQYLANPPRPTPAPAPVKEAGFSLKDIGAAFGQGAVGSAQSLTNVAGAGNAASQYLGDVSESLGKQYTPERQAEMQRQQQRMKKAEESGSTWEEIKAAAQNIYEAPLQSAAQGLGSFVPYVPAMFAGPAAAALGLGSRAVAAANIVARAYAPVVGTAQGAGSVKGAIYDAVYKAEKESGLSESEARQKATAAQDYTGKNLDQIALGAGLGYVASKGGIEKFLTKEGREKAAEKLLPRVTKAVTEESVTEGAQGGQERLASNIALQRTGRDVPTFQGVGGQAAQDAITAALTAGAVSIPQSGKAPVEDLTKRASTTAGQEALDIVNAPPPERVKDVEPVINPPVGASVPVAGKREVVQPAEGAIAPEGVGVGATVPPAVLAATGEGEQPATLNFTTAKGSQYFVDKDGKTSRTKLSPGKGQGETYAPHTALYVQSGDHTEILSDMQGGMGNNSVRLGYIDDNKFNPITSIADIPNGTKPTVAVFNKNTNDVVGIYPAFTVPKIGLHPVEKLYTNDGNSNTHIGNKITNISVPTTTEDRKQPTALSPELQKIYDAYATRNGKIGQGSEDLAIHKIKRLTDLANIHNQPINVWLHQGEIVPLGASVPKPKFARLIGTVNPTGEAPAATEVVTPPQAPATQQVAEIGDYHLGLAPELSDTFERLQNRDRAGQRSVAQMKKISNEADYDLLSIDPNLGSGAPVVISDFKLPEIQLGKTDVATAVDGRKVPFQYAVVSANNLLPSHTSDGQVNSTYADPSVPAIRPVAGNGRVAGLQEGYGKSSPALADYAAKMAVDPRHGIDPNVIKAMPNPVLIRIMPKTEITKNIGDVSNVSTGLELSPLEKAKNDANRLDLSNVEFEESEDGSLKLNKKSATQFIQAMPENERGTMVDSRGEPNTVAMDRLRNAMFWKAYSSDRLGHLYTEATDPEAKLILSAMQKAVPKMVQLEGAGIYDVRPNVVEAAEMAVNARRKGVPLKDLVNQEDMTRDPTTQAVLEMFAGNSRSGNRMGDLLGRFADEAYKDANVVEDMFGEKPQRPLSEIAEALKPAEEEVKLATPEEKKAPPELVVSGIIKRKDRHPQVQAAAKLLQEGKMTREEFAKYSDYYNKPIVEISKDELNPPTTNEKMLETINSNKVDKINVPIADGTLVGLRMDLPALKRGGAVVSIHEGKPGLKNPGDVISFQSVGHLIGGKKGRVTFEPRSQEVGLNVAIGEEKRPLQTVEGIWKNIAPEAAFAKVKELMGKPGWTQVSLNPARHGYFYDRKTGEPVKSASEIYQVGNFLLAKDVEFAPKSEFLYMTRDATPEQIKSADVHAEEVGGNVVYQKGDIALVRGFSKLTGEPVYAVAKGDTRSRVDVESYTGKMISEGEKQELIAEKKKLEAEDAKKHKENPFITFDKNGLSFSKGVPVQVGKVLAGWKDLLKLAPNIYITTVEDARNNVENYTGEHRAIGSVGLDYKQRGVMRQLPSGDYYVAFTKSTSITKMLETLAHELGHVHQKEVFDKSSPEVKKAITEEYWKWAMSQDKKTAKELILSLRAKTTGKTTKVPDNLMAKDLTNYWRSFSEWYADQTAKWAVTSEKPVGVVEKFFTRLGKALRSFYAKVRNSGYLPSETFKKYLDTVTKENIEQHLIVSKPEDQMSLFMKSEVEPVEIEKAGTEEGQAALNITGGLGRVSEKPDSSYMKQVREAWDNATNNPKATASEAKAAVIKFIDLIQTKAFSSDAAINNSIRREVNEFVKDNEQAIGTMLNISQSQVVHADALANLFLTSGNLKYNKELYKYEAVEDKSNIVELAKQLGEIKEKYGLTQAQTELIGHTAFEAKRLKSLLQFNNQVDQEVAEMRAEADKLAMDGKEVAAHALREKATRRSKETKFIHMTGAEISAGNKLFKVIPELNGVVDTWNQMRDNAANLLVDSGLWSKDEAEFLLSNADYVPFFREEQLEKGKGPKEYIRGLMVQAQEKKLKGSSKPVNDIFDNMNRWMQYSVNRAVRNRSALALIDTASEFGQAKRIESKSDGDNAIRVWRNGKEEFYDMADPMFVEAFTGLESISIPAWKWASTVANILRQSVVLNPLFTVAQIPQDSFAAMFTSGLKAPYALQIPARAVKEFIKTLAHRSATNNELKKYGVVGVRDFTSQMARLDAQVYAGMKSSPGILGRLKSSLEHIAMAGDNAVRQATYEAATAQGLSKAEAIEKSFEIWNIRRKGTSQSLAIASQVIPFFGAYLAAQNVALKTISGVGTSPTERKAALGALVGTTASVMTLSLLYAMMNGDDEDYLKKPAAIRDRMLMVPGTNGFGIPLRSDLFSIPKIITEHMYLMMTDKGYEDGRKFRDSMANALGNSFFSPTVVPQAIKPGLEVMVNYDFFQGRPLIGEYQKRLEKERQFNESTSEIAKILGKTGLVSPISADHLIRGMLGSAGGLFIYMTNPLLHSDPNVDKPTMSAKDMLATIPGASSFVSKEKESALKADFYVLRDEVAKVTNTLSDLKQRNPEKIAEYITDPDVMAKLTVSKGVQGIDKKLGEIRKAMTRISNLPTSVMDSDEKQNQIKQLRESETQMLKAINVKNLREMAKI